MPPRSDSPIVIAHRGACGYLPEHTLCAKALAFGMGADYLEQDVVLTRDDEPIVLHDIHLDTVTDVATRFPGRQRDDGRYYAIDFTWEEIRRLAVHERIDLDSQDVVFDHRFPNGRSRFSVPSLAEEIEMIQGLAHSSGREAGLYVELKLPSFHRAEGRDMSRVVLERLAGYGYRDRDAKIYLQCFDASELRRLRTELDCRMQLVQLIGENDWADAVTDCVAMRTAEGLAEIAGYADGIGPRIEHLIDHQAELGGEPRPNDLVPLAHREGLVVHPYTLRRDQLPAGMQTIEQAMSFLLEAAAADGVFTDFPDDVVAYLRRAAD